MKTPKFDQLIENDQTIIRLTRDFYVDLGMGIKFTVPQGFKCDGASVPRWAWSLVGHPFEGRALPAAIAHDWLCRLAETREQRALADAVFFLALAIREVGPWRRRIMAATVYMWGWKRFRRRL